MHELLLNIPKPSNNFPIIPDNGPGPRSLRNYDDVHDLGYFGTLTQAELFSYGEVETAAKAPLGGTSVNRGVDNRWIKAYSKGKVIYMPMMILRSDVLWADIYKAGMLYGTDDFGLWQPGGAGVNQMTTLKKTAVDGSVLTVKVRAIRAYDDMTWATPLTEPKYIGSEWYGIRWRLLGLGPGNPNVPWWEVLGAINGTTFSVETNAAHTQALMLANGHSWGALTPWDITVTKYSSFYPVLEIVSITRP